MDGYANIPAKITLPNLYMSNVNWYRYRNVGEGGSVPEEIIHIEEEHFSTAPVSKKPKRDSVVNNTY